jgi:hypothetical protein
MQEKTRKVKWGTRGVSLPITLTPLLPPVLTPSAKAISYQFYQTLRFRASVALTFKLNCGLTDE